MHGMESEFCFKVAIMELLTIFGDRFSDDEVEEMYRKAPIKNVMFDIYQDQQHPPLCKSDNFFKKPSQHYLVGLNFEFDLWLMSVRVLPEKIIGIIN